MKGRLAWPTPMHIITAVTVMFCVLLHLQLLADVKQTQP